MFHSFDKGILRTLGHIKLELVKFIGHTLNELACFLIYNERVFLSFAERKGERHKEAERCYESNAVDE